LDEGEFSNEGNGRREKGRKGRRSGKADVIKRGQRGRTGKGSGEQLREL
jgi:hypothetical protein